MAGRHPLPYPPPAYFDFAIRHAPAINHPTWPTIQTSQLNITNESQEVSPFTALTHKKSVYHCLWCCHGDWLYSAALFCSHHIHRPIASRLRWYVYKRVSSVRLELQVSRVVWAVVYCSCVGSIAHLGSQADQILLPRLCLNKRS